jgi:hypothetical protein
MAFHATHVGISYGACRHFQATLTGISCNGWIRLLTATEIRQAYREQRH